MSLHPDRVHHVGASECAALWSLGWESRYRLWARKSGLLPHDGEDTNGSKPDFLRIGLYLEPAIAKLVALETGWRLRKVHRYTRHKKVEGMGASLDYEISGGGHGGLPGVLEIKSADGSEFARWIDGEPPIQYELQLQHQLACTGREWGAIGVLVSNRKLHLFQRQASMATIAKIEAEIPRFWEEVREHREPADAPADTETTIALYRTVYDGEIADLSMDDEAQALANRYRIAAASQRQAEQEKDEAKAGLLRKMGTASLAYLPEGKIKSWTVAESSYTTTRKAYRAVRITTPDPVEVANGT